jgi:hypothetical protein
MEDLVGVVSRPQFDVNTFSTGKAIHIVGNSKGLNFDRDCLIVKSTPLSMEIVYVDNEHDTVNFTVGIEEVVTKRMRITLKEDKK